MRKRTFFALLITIFAVLTAVMVARPVYADDELPEDTENIVDNNTTNEDTNNLPSDNGNAEKNEILGVSIEDIRKAFNEEYDRIMQNNIVLSIAGVLGAIVATYVLVSPILIKAKKSRTKNDKTINDVDKSNQEVNKTVESAYHLIDVLKQENQSMKNTIEEYENKIDEMSNEVNNYKKEINNLNIQQSDLLSVVKVIVNQDKDFVANGVAEKVNKIIENRRG